MVCVHGAVAAPVIQQGRGGHTPRGRAVQDVVALVSKGGVGAGGRAVHVLGGACEGAAAEGVEFRGVGAGGGAVHVLGCVCEGDADRGVGCEGVGTGAGGGARVGEEEGSASRGCDRGCS